MTSRAIAQAIKSVAAETGILDVITAMQTVQQAMSDTMKAVNTALGNNTYGDTNTLLLQGFTQNANYSKAQVGALQQIADASNTANARFSRDMRNAQIRDEQTASPTHCAAIDGGVSTQSASVQAFGVAQTIAAIHDARGEAGVGMPSHFGQAQGIASMSAEHLGLYCNADDAAANLCSTVSANPDADQKASNFLGSGAYADQNAVNTAKDVAVNLIQPVAPAALRGDQLASVGGQDAAVRRHSYNARMSLAQTFMDNTIGMQVPSIPLTASQTQYMQNMGLTVPRERQWIVDAGAPDRGGATGQRCRLAHGAAEHATGRRGARDGPRAGDEQLPALPELQDGPATRDDQRHALGRGHGSAVHADLQNANALHGVELTSSKKSQESADGRHTEQRTSTDPTDEPDAAFPRATAAADFRTS